MYARDLDLNLLRVFVVVAETGSVTAAAARLYLTQPAISSALKRLASAVGAPLFARQGRGLALTTRGERLLSAAKPHLSALVDAALSPSGFDPATSDRTLRIGMSDASETWLLPALMKVLTTRAPNMRVIVVPVHFRNVGAAFSNGALDLALTVADELPAGCTRKTLFVGGFACVFDPRHARVGRKLTREKYLEHRHVIVSYNGDLRGIIEDFFGVHRKVAVSVPTFHSVGALVDGTSLLATVPIMAARRIVTERPHLKTAPLPFELRGAAMELMWRTALDDDGALRFAMEHIEAIAKRLTR